MVRSSDLTTVKQYNYDDGETQRLPWPRRWDPAQNTLKLGCVCVCAQIFQPPPLLDERLPTLSPDSPLTYRYSRRPHHRTSQGATRRHPRQLHTLVPSRGVPRLQARPSDSQADTDRVYRVGARRGAAHANRYVKHFEQLHPAALCEAI